MTTKTTSKTQFRDETWYPSCETSSKTLLVRNFEI